MKWICALILSVGLACPAAAQCRSYSAYHPTYSYSCAPAYTYSSVYAYPVTYPYLDQRFQVVYNLEFPPLAATGSTVYGYQTPTAVGLDPAGYLNAAGRYAEYGGQLAQTGTANFNTSVQNLAAAQQQATELQIRQQLTRAIMSAPAGMLQGSTGSIQFAPGVNGQMQLQAAAPTSTAPAPPADGSEAVAAAPPSSLQGVANSKCVECHGGARKERGLDLRNLGALNGDQVQLVLKKIMSSSSDRMPPPEKPQLTPEEKLAFVAGATQAQPKESPAGSKAPATAPQSPPQPAAPDSPAVVPKK